MRISNCILFLFFSALPAMNKTDVTEIILLGFQNLHGFKYVAFFSFLVIYLITIIGNALIILLVSTSTRLQSPMFFFLGHLSFSDMLLTSNIVPNMLHIIIFEGGILPLRGCITQFVVYGSSVASESLLLTAMSFDRYLAICRPLHYTTVMDLKLCLCLVSFSWMIGTAITVITVFMRALWFCGPNVIDHFFCDLVPLLELSCSDMTIVKYQVFTVSGLMTTIPFMFITITYVYIFLTILRITSASGRQKTFSTCSSHLTVVCTYYGALFVMYVVPSTGKSFNIKKVATLMYTVVTPLFNPVIYSLRNQELKLVIWKYVAVLKKNNK
ncbi:olfactory receptor 5G25-like [Hyperolius riggenbachi]|uniref:olfactory receptor 5G25-like n=1 Tax=Hyperolius riggenbachi TaxID=752182 RepID=UPI0035A3002A